MVQLYKLILWKHRMPNSDASSLTDLVYAILQELIKFDESLYPKYLPAGRKKDVKQFVLSQENIFSLIDRSLKNERKISAKLGAIISFFTSLTDEAATGISFTLGYDSPRLNNAIVIDFYENAISEILADKAEIFYTTFQTIVNLFNPDYAFVVNSATVSFPAEYEKNGKPGYIHWLNYFDNETVEKIGRKNFAGLEDTIVTPNGIFLRLQKYPLDIYDAEAIAYQEYVKKKLKL